MTITPSTRCVGRRDLRLDSTVCPVRNDCGRYQALQAGGILIVDARAMLCSPPDFAYRTEAQALPSPKCDGGEAVESVRSDTEKVT